MIAEPYICTKGWHIGEIEWFQIGRQPTTWKNSLGTDKAEWVLYADFEREKLKTLQEKRGCSPYSISNDGGWFLMGYDSEDLIGYSPYDYCRDSESSRLLKRAEFLKAVCEKENVPWLCDCLQTEHTVLKDGESPLSKPHKVCHCKEVCKTCGHSLI